MPASIASTVNSTSRKARSKKGTSKKVKTPSFIDFPFSYDDVLVGRASYKEFVEDDGMDELLVAVDSFTVHLPSIARQWMANFFQFKGVAHVCGSLPKMIFQLCKGSKREYESIMTKVTGLCLAHLRWERHLRAIDRREVKKLRHLKIKREEKASQTKEKVLQTIDERQKKFQEPALLGNQDNSLEQKFPNGIKMMKAEEKRIDTIKRTEFLSTLRGVERKIRLLTLSYQKWYDTKVPAKDIWMVRDLASCVLKVEAAFCADEDWGITEKIVEFFEILADEYTAMAYEFDSDADEEKYPRRVNGGNNAGFFIELALLIRSVCGREINFEAKRLYKGAPETVFPAADMSAYIRKQASKDKPVFYREEKTVFNTPGTIYCEGESFPRIVGCTGG